MVIVVVVVVVVLLLWLLLLLLLLHIPGGKEVKDPELEPEEEEEGGEAPNEFEFVREEGRLGAETPGEKKRN